MHPQLDNIFVLNLRESKSAIVGCGGIHLPSKTLFGS